MAEREVRRIDPFTAGEIPDPLTLTFYEGGRDLTGWDVAVTMTRDGVEFTPGGTVDWVDAATGQVGYEWAEDDLIVADDEESSSYRMEFWAGNGTIRIASLLILFDVYRQVGTVPAI